MDSGAAALSEEITRIISCPYPASLSTLADLLRRVNSSTLTACISGRPQCEVSRLAVLVCDALPLWSYTLQVLQHLCHAPVFGHELLLVKPELLSTLLTKATSSQQGYDEYSELCVLLLARPLPESISLPAAAQSFFLDVSERALKNEDVSTFRSVYRMLNGACRKIFGYLTADVQEQFDRQLRRLLTSSSARLDSTLSLWCCGIVLLAERPDPPEHTAWNSGLTPQWKTAAGQTMFGTTKGSYKTLNIICLSIILVLKSHDTMSIDEAIEGIRIASIILQSIEPNVRQTWPKSSPLAQNNFQKLFETLRFSGFSEAILFEALCFYSMMATPGHLQTEIVARYEQSLINAAHFAEPVAFKDTLGRSLRIFATQMTEESIQILLRDILDACLSGLSCQMTILATLVESLTIEIGPCGALAVKMLSSLSGTALTTRLENFLRSKPDTQASGCITYTKALRRNLISATIALLLKLSHAAPPEGTTFPHTLTIALIDKQKHLSTIDERCSHHIEQKDGRSISLFQQESTPYTGQHLQDWRDRLTSELESQGFYQRDSIIRSVSQICQDLEWRCQTVEEPLRREQARSRELEKRISQLTQQVTSLESQAADDRFHLDGLEDEKLHIADEKDKLDADFAQLKCDAHEALCRAQDKIRDKEVEMHSTILNHEESLRIRNAKIEELNFTLSRSKEDVARYEGDIEVVNERNHILQTRLQETEEKLQQHLHNISQLGMDVTRLEQERIELQGRLKDSESKSELISRQLSDLQFNHQELDQTSKERIKGLEVKYEYERQMAATDFESQREDLNAQLQSALHDAGTLRDAHKQRGRELQHLQSSIPPLENRIHELTKVCSEQDTVISELRTWQRYVVASMPVGLGAQNPLSLRAASQSPKPDRGPNHGDRQEHRRRKSVVPAQEYSPSSAPNIDRDSAQLDTQKDVEPSFTYTDARFSQDVGTTPKRLKSHPDHQPSVLQGPRSQRLPATSTSTSKRKPLSCQRSVLRHISSNRRHTTGGVRLSDDEEEHDKDFAKQKRGSLQSSAQPELVISEDFPSDSLLSQESFIAGTGRFSGDGKGSTTEL
ncbi:hypothetical protein IQ07DRAFT_496719 [Pyrenochaeta sp. DS3sAY3a]|nr:hypothetical protein IQ07DRAFT_496719 [Pyrenochaeta sp. DS3sAY3a]